MAIKICLNNEIHRFSKLPINLKALIDVIISTFQHQLPPSRSIYYIDSEGDKVTLSHDQDYQDLIESEAKDSSATLKLFVVAREGGSVVGPQSSIAEKIQEIPSEKKKPVQEIQQDYQVIGSPEQVQSVQNDLVQQQKQGIPQPSQNIWEKTAQADYAVIDRNSQQLNEVHPRAHPQPLDEGKGKMHEAKHLFWRLSKRDVSESEKTRMSERLKEIEENLTSEEKTIYEQKREKWARIAAMKQGRCPRGSKSKERSGSKPRNIHKAKHLFKKLSKRDISEEKRARITEKLQKIEESLSPEEKNIFAQKKENWARKAAMKQSRCPGGSKERSESKQRGLDKAKHLFKKLSKKHIPEEKRARVAEKLQKIEESLTPEEKSIYEQNKEEWARKAAMKCQFKHRRGSKGRSESKDGIVHEAKHLFKKLSHKDMPEEKRAMMQEKLKQIEETLTPEQKAVFDQKKEKWQRKGAMKHHHFRHHRGSREEFKEMEVKTDEQGRPIHTHIPCANCQTVPIVGIRYKCAICHHFDLCEACEATVEHPHPMLKIKSPAMMAMLWQKRFSQNFEGRHGGHWAKHGGRHGRPFKGFKMLKKLDKMIDALQRGDLEKVNHCKQRAQERLPEEAQKILEPVFALMTESADQEALRKAVEQAKEQLLSLYHPEGREQGSEHWKQFQGRPHHHHHGHGFHHRHGFKKEFMKSKEDQM